jgi:hypothetical protein
LCANYIEFHLRNSMLYLFMGIILSKLINSTLLDFTVARFVTEQTNSFTNSNATAPYASAAVSVIQQVLQSL